MVRRLEFHHIDLLETQQAQLLFPYDPGAFSAPTASQPELVSRRICDTEKGTAVATDRCGVPTESLSSFDRISSLIRLMPTPRGTRTMMVKSRSWLEGLSQQYQRTIGVFISSLSESSLSIIISSDFPQIGACNTNHPVRPRQKRISWLPITAAC